MDLKRYILNELSDILEHYHGDRINDDNRECICEDIERKLFGPYSWYTADGQMVDLYSVGNRAPICNNCRNFAMGYVTLPDDKDPTHYYCVARGLMCMREITVPLENPCGAFAKKEEE